MTFHIPAQQAAFKFTLLDGLPLATVEKWGNGLWIVCCPLCGSLHNLPANIKPDHQGITYQPNCIAKKVHSHMYHQWLEEHPRAWEFDTVRAVLRLRDITVLPVPQAPGKQPLIAAGKAA